jgi:hypothetical protein
MHPHYKRKGVEWEDMLSTFVSQVQVQSRGGGVDISWNLDNPVPELALPPVNDYEFRLSDPQRMFNWPIL